MTSGMRCSWYADEASLNGLLRPGRNSLRIEQPYARTHWISPVTESGPWFGRRVAAWSSNASMALVV